MAARVREETRRSRRLGLPSHRWLRVRHGALREQHFLELAGDLAVKVEFILTDEMADRLRQESASVVYARMFAEFDVIDDFGPWRSRRAVVCAVTLELELDKPYYGNGAARRLLRQ
jgi:hypothetical protein